MTTCKCGKPTRDEAYCASVLERFAAKTDRRGEGECWPWLGTILSNGYGQLSHDRGGSRWLAHRLAYEIAFGPIADGLTVDHVKARGCVRTDCVNPAHLEAVTMQENLRRSDAWSAVNSRKDTCPEGHEFDRVRRRTNGSTYRECSECANRWQREYRAKRKRKASA